MSPTPELAPWISSVSPRLSRPAVTTALCRSAARPESTRLARRSCCCRGSDARGQHRSRRIRQSPGRRGENTIARLEVLDLAADRLDLAGTFQTDPRAHAADAAVLDAGSHQRIGAIEARGADLDQDLIGLRSGFGRSRISTPLSPRTAAFMTDSFLLSLMAFCQIFVAQVFVTIAQALPCYGPGLTVLSSMPPPISTG